MRSELHFKIAAMATLMVGIMPSAATAQITDVRSETVGSITLRSGPVGTTSTGPIINGPSPDYRNDTSGRGAGFAALADIEAESIFFQSASMSGNERNSSSSLTEVQIDFTGDTPGGEVDRLVSVVFGSSFGFYVGDFGGGGCTGANLPGCEITDNGIGFSGVLLGINPVRDGLAGTSISFEVLLDGNLVRSLNGSITMIRDGNGSIAFVEDFGSGDDALGNALIGFGLSESNNYAHFYSWDQTNLTTMFDDPIGFEESGTVTFRVRSETWVQTRSNDTNGVVAFGCISDPLGRGGRSAGVSGLRAQSFDLPRQFETICDDYVDEAGQPETVYEVDLPRIEDGAIVFTPGAVPEPATWAMLIAGFGLVGTAARRRARAAQA